jgi:tRNA nucleotidyltransferase (CCA-adding enzyme)
VINILQNLGKLAKKLNMKVYLVGGIVRDIILNRKNLDIDIIVEGDAIKLAKEFARQNNYSFHKFDEFLTANIKTKDGLKIDFATARKEVYDYPGAYPRVKKATLKEDLFRRDFTINTLAIEITENNFGIMLDYFNGYKDIKDKVIRILHQLSFIEDPIRILRAVRFAGRFNFHIGKTTEKLLKVAIDQKLLNVAPTGRINLELNLTFNEHRVIEIINLMDKYKILQSLFPNFFLSEEKKEFLENAKNHIIMFEEFFSQKVNKSKVYLTILLYHLPLEVSYQVLKKYHFENVFKVLNEFLSLIDKITPQKKPSELYHIIKNVANETKILIISYTDEELSKKLIEIIKKTEEKRLIINGKDLTELGLKPSPKFAEIIETVFKAYLDGKIKDKKEAKEFVKQNYLVE